MTTMIALSSYYVLCTMYISQTNTSPSLPPGSKAVTLEELEREYLTPSPSTNSTSQPHSSPQPSNHTPQSGVAPSVGIGLAAAPTAPYPLVGGPLPPPMPIGQMPPIGVHVGIYMYCVCD